MRAKGGIALVVGLVLVLAGCETRTDETDGGGVLLSITDFDQLPTQVTVNSAGSVVIGSITIQNVPKDPTGLTSELMNVEMDSYEVVFTRGDTGTRVPPPLVRGILGVAPVGGTETYTNLPILTTEQLQTAPLSDLLFQNGAFDKETGDQTVLLNLRLRFFGRTLSGDDVDTLGRTFTVEFVP